MTTEAAGQGPVDRVVRPGARAHPAPAVLDTDDIELLREALAVAWGDLMTAQLKQNDQAAEIERLNFQRQILQSESERLRSRNARLRVEITREIIAQGWTAPKLTPVGASDGNTYAAV